eukprot:5483713-Prymnesium_polylepis.1
MPSVTATIPPTRLTWRAKLTMSGSSREYWWGEGANKPLSFVAMVDNFDACGAGLFESWTPLAY